MYLTRPFNHPIAGFLFIETAGIANKAFHFTILIFTCSYAQYVFALVPKCHLAAAFFMIAIAVRLYRLGKPNTVFKTQSLISQCTYRAHVDHISCEIIIDSSLDVS